MKVLIRPVSDVKLTIDGQELPGTFTLVSEWEGFAKFMCAEPPGFVVVEHFSAKKGLLGLFFELCSQSSPLNIFNEGVRAKVVRMSVGIQGEVDKKRVAEPAVDPVVPVAEPAAAVPAGQGAAGFSPGGRFDEPVMVGGRRRAG